MILSFFSLLIWCLRIAQLLIRCVWSVLLVRTILMWGGKLEGNQNWDSTGFPFESTHRSIPSRTITTLGISCLWYHKYSFSKKSEVTSNQYLKYRLNFYSFKSTLCSILKWFYISKHLLSILPWSYIECCHRWASLIRIEQWITSWDEHPFVLLGMNTRGSFCLSDYLLWWGDMVPNRCAAIYPSDLVLRWIPLSLVGNILAVIVVLS